MNISERIIQLRKQHGLSQELLGEKLNVSRQAISKWESGKATPDLSYIVQMCELFNVSTDYFILGKEPVEEKNDCIIEKDIQVNVAPAPVKVVSSSNKAFWFGILLTLLGCIGIIIFITLSIVHPWGSMTEYGYFEGLLGYLIGTKSIFWFALCSVLGFIGIGICIYHAFMKRDLNA